MTCQSAVVTPDITLMMSAWFNQDFRLSNDFPV